LKEKIAFYEAMEERRVKLQLFVSAPQFDLDDKVPRLTPLPLSTISLSYHLLLFIRVAVWQRYS